MFEVTITENDLLNLEQQYLSYTVYLEDSAGIKTLTYANSHFNACGTIYIDNCSFPGPIPTVEVNSFTQESFSSNIFNSSAVSAEPAINGNEALHTAVVYTNNFVGNVKVQATLSNQVTDNTPWADINTLSFVGTETQPVPVNFNGVFSHIRFQTDANPDNKITKILVRN
jgi:hypothetical protein